MSDSETTTKPKLPKGRPSVQVDFNEKPMAVRLRGFRIKYVDKNQLPAAKKLGIPQSSLSAFEAGHRAIPIELIMKLVNDFQLNQEWLTMGTGNMQDKNPPKSGLVTDINAVQSELVNLTKYIKFMEANQKYLVNKLGEMAEKMSKMEDRLAKLEAGKS